ncbi:helix-turn-helix domain-containing protein [Olivibacter sp. CPCC 100613]|uniref:winged helix-turn-helix transcriptional regulator n=1 Tax=Olivibacter sp. CPCC 100613 TaxID=3079931 RepID=UPI002FF71033
MANYERKIPILDCGHEYTRRVLHGKWKIRILLYIAEGINRPSELERHIPQATRRVLDAQLAELFKHGIIAKTIFDESVKHVEYYLTDLGNSLMPIVAMMGKWGNTHIDKLRKAINTSTALA